MNKYIFIGFLAISSFCYVSATSIIPPPTSTTTDGNGVVVDTVEDTIDCASITHSLKLGSRDTATGGDVTTLQTFLSQANYLESDPTGYFGRATKKAVQDFQKANGIDPQGNVGPYTRAKIKLISCRTTAISPTTKNTYQGGYSYTNLLKEVKILDPVWSIPEDGAGTVSVSISNLPKDDSIDNYSLSIYCNGLSLLRNGVDLCSESKDIKNLYTGSLNYDFAYKIQGETQNGARGVTILLLANNSNNKAIGTSLKVSYQQKATPKSTPITNGASSQEAIGFGVYEGMYPNNDSPHSYGYHPEGTIVLTIPATANGKVLVLTSYEPVNWVLSNPNNVTPKKIIAVGYHKQRVTAQGLNVQVDVHSYETDGVYQYAYQKSGQEFNNLVSWLYKQGVILTSYNFTGVYAAKDSSIFNSKSIPVVSDSTSSSLNTQVPTTSASPSNTQTPLQIDETSQTKLLLEVLEPMDQGTTIVGIGGEVVEGPIDNEAKISFAIGYYSPFYYLEIEPEISVSSTEGNPGYTVNINNFGYERYLNGSVTPFGAGGHSKYKVTGSTGTLFVSRNTNDRRPLYLTMRVIDPTKNLIKATQKIAVTAKK